MTLRHSVILLVVGGACIALAQGSSAIPIAAFVGYALLLRFVRSHAAWVGYAGFVLAHTIAWDIAYAETMPLPLLGHLMIAASLSLVLGLVFLADRRVARRSRSFAATLVFPAGQVGLDYVMGAFSPGGSGGSIAYSFSDHLALAQLASITGWTGLTFMVGWVASTASWAWEQRGEAGRAVRGMAVCAGVLATILAAGGVRLWTHPAGETVRIAGIVGPTTYSQNGARRPDVMDYLRRNSLSASERAAARGFIRAAIDRNLELAEAELRAGARIVLLPEASPVVTADEASLARGAAQRLATAYDAYVGLGLFVYPATDDTKAQNVFVLLGPAGEMVWEYQKSRLVPGSDHAIGPGLLPERDAGFARLSAAICFDLDFPALIRQAGRKGADIMLAPSNDWTGIRILHARMARMRAIENGFSLVRPTRGGISLATDPLGRTLAWQDTDRPGDHVLVADVPTAGVGTLYARVGDLFSWLCALGFGAAMVWLLVARGRGRCEIERADWTPSA